MDINNDADGNLSNTLIAIVCDDITISLSLQSLWQGDNNQLAFCHFL